MNTSVDSGPQHRPLPSYPVLDVGNSFPWVRGYHSEVSLKKRPSRENLALIQLVCTLCSVQSPPSSRRHRRELFVVGMAGKLLALGALVSVSADEGFNNFFDLTAIDIRGQPHPFEQYRGNVVLAVNVATD